MQRSDRWRLYVTGEQLGAVRQRLGVSQAELAALLYVPLDRLRGWEAAGQVPISGRWHREMNHVLAWAEYEAGVQNAGIPSCEWATAWNRIPFPLDDEEMLKSLDDVAEHEKACPICTARQRYAERHPPPKPLRPPMPGGAPMRALLTTVERLPHTLQPVVLGALMNAALAAGVIVLHALSSPGWLRLEFGLAALAASIVAGAAGGAAYVATRWLRARTSASGAYLSGLICATAWFGVFMLIIDQVQHRNALGNPVDWLEVSVLICVAGLAVGHGWVRKVPAGAEQGR